MSKSNPPYTQFIGGIDLVTPPTATPPGRLLFGDNIDALVEGGYRPIKGYTKIGANVPGEGDILGVAVFQADQPIAIRAVVGSSSATMWKNVGGTWTSVQTNLPIGRYTFATGTFTALGTDRRLFMQCDNAVAYPWMYDGTTMTELTSAPQGGKFIKVHALHLFVALESGSLQWSALGDPPDWTAINGAGEVGVSDFITGLSSAREALIIGCEKSVHILYGTSLDDFALKPFVDNFGIKPYTMTELVAPIMVGQHGPTSLGAVQDFGNFSFSDWGKFIEPLFKANAGETPPFIPVAAVGSRDNNQYRIFAADGSGVRITVVGGVMYGATTTVFPHNVTCAFSGRDNAADEVGLFGSDTGAVYLMDSGNSFDGTAIISTITTVFNHFKSPVVRKRFRRIFLDAVPKDAIEVKVLPQFDGGSTESARHRNSVKNLSAAGALWGAALWGDFVWSGPLSAQEAVSVEATASSMSLLIQITRTTEDPPTIGGYTTVFGPGRVRRG